MAEHQCVLCAVFVFVFVAQMREAITDISIKPRQSGPLAYTSRLDADILGPTVHSSLETIV